MSTETDETVDNVSKSRKNRLLQGMSPYELERLENIRQNQAFLTAIDLPQAKAALKRRPDVKREKAKVSKQEVLPLRKSLRLRKKTSKTLPLPEKQPSTIQQGGPIAMAPVNVERDSCLPASLLELWREPLRLFMKPLQVKKKTKGKHSTVVTKRKWNLEEYEASLKTMGLSARRVVKVVWERICSAAFHPCPSRLFLAAGDRFGYVGLWDEEGDWGDDGVLLFKPHTGAVCCMAFSNTQSTSLLTLSYDGSLRATDVERAVFDELYHTDVELSSFDFLSHDCSTFLVSDWEGDVAIVDRRTRGTSHASLYTLDRHVLPCVHVHPIQKQYFVAAESRDVRIYDVRSLRRKACQPVSTLAGHTLAISSAYFSPVTGNRVLTTCLDDTIRVFDTSEFIPVIPLQSSVRQLMKTSKRIRAVWDPKKEDCFLVGSMEWPRRMELFHESGRLLRSFQDGEHLSSICPVTVIHPSRSALAGGNSNGRIHIFTN